MMQSSKTMIYFLVNKNGLSVVQKDTQVCLDLKFTDRMGKFMAYSRSISLTPT